MKKLELEEKVITAKHLKAHKKVWNILTYGVLGIIPKKERSLED